MTSVTSAANPTRTYIAKLDVKPDFAAANAATDRVSRKVAAVAALSAAEVGVQRVTSERLDALREQGLVSGFEYVPLLGTAIITVPEAKAGAAFEALRGVETLGRIVRDREVRLEPSAREDGSVQNPPAPSPPPVGPHKLEWNVIRVGAPDLWKQGIDGTGVVVGVVDSGARPEHVGIKAHYRGTKQDGTFDDNYNFFDAWSNKPAHYDDHGHGSHVAGTAVGGSDERQIGVAPGAKFIAAKSFNKYGSGKVSTILQGLSWMLAPRDSSGGNPDATKAPDIVSNSWGDDDNGGRTLAYVDIWKAFDAAGIIRVAAAGNTPNGPRLIDAPGSYPETITVTATDGADAIAYFASRGPSPIKDPDGQYYFKPDIAAPGNDIVSVGPGTKYWHLSGTSMATPAISGVVALLLQKYPNLTQAQVKSLLVDTAKDIGAKGPDHEAGHGLVNAVAAMQLADQRFGTQQPPTA